MIERIPFGRTDFEVSRICLGTWQAHGWSTSDDDQIVKTIEKALDLGVNFIDTATNYGNGHSEQLVAKAITGRRDSCIIATKAPFTHATPKKLREALEKSLSDLGTDYIDLYQQHWPPKSPPLDETIAELEKFKEEGKIRAIGVSNWMEQEWSEVSDPARIHSLQPCYSLLWRHIEKSVLPLCREHRIAVIPYSPLCQGFLTGKFRDRTKMPKDSRKQNVLAKEEVFPAVLTFLDVLEEIAERLNQSMATVSLRWLLQQPGITSVIAGCSKPEQIEENVKALTFELSEEDMKTLSDTSESIIGLTKNFKSLWNWHSRA